MRADLFCKRVDNYGDIGVCWRLARELRDRGNWDVRLWVDDLAAFRRLEPAVDPALRQQAVAGIDIVHWTEDVPLLAPAEVVIEAFACDPPPAYRAAMRERQPIWLNLEYLSAEDWVASFHGLPSPQPDGLMKYFFFPGFTRATGGLLRERGLLQARDTFQASRAQQRDFLAGLDLPAAALAAWEGGACAVTLFCYPGAPYPALAQAMAGGQGRPTLLLAPEGVAPGLEAAMASMACSALQLARVPFLTQDGYDRLLWCADVNFVRGEDSFVRAAWAARPLVWQIYPQEEDAHLVKLEAWLASYIGGGRFAEADAGDAAGAAGATAAAELIRAWNGMADAPALGQAWQAAMQPAALAEWQGLAHGWADALSAQQDLASSLLEFCANLPRQC